MRTNILKKIAGLLTHEGARAARMTPERELRRSVMACMLWEDEFYETGVEIGARIRKSCDALPFDTVAAVAVEARERMKLRHAPLWLAVALAGRKAGAPMGELLARIIQRPDELAEFLALYWKDGKRPLGKQVKRGLALAFGKFDEYQLAKYNRDAAVKLRDVLFLCHAKPRDAEQAALWKRLVDGELATPDTWEVALSGGADKKATFERLIVERKLGALAFLRNLRNMLAAGVHQSMIRDYLRTANLDRVLPFRFIAAANHAPKLEDALEEAMLRSMADVSKLAGKTAIVVDNSGSMYGAKVSTRSEITRSDAACALAILIREICRESVIIAFATTPTVVAPRRGFALRDAIKTTERGGTNTDDALALAEREGYDRIIVITDEQSHQSIRGPKGRGYFINVASAKNGIGYGKWTHIDGWSEAVVDYIRAAETLDQ